MATVCVHTVWGERSATSPATSLASAPTAGCGSARTRLAERRVFCKGLFEDTHLNRAHRLPADRAGVLPAYEHRRASGAQASVAAGQQPCLLPARCVVLHADGTVPIRWRFVAPARTRASPIAPARASVRRAARRRLLRPGRVSALRQRGRRRRQGQQDVRGKLAVLHWHVS